jgi:eukaryotic-like serine/threonine-protein kinase
MPVAHGKGRIARFGLYEADLDAKELRREGRLVPLQEHPFVVLGALLESEGREVSREELRRRLWPDQGFLDFENGINTAVARLRQALGDSADNPRFVGTRPRHGYRWLTPIQWPAPPAGTEGVATGAASPVLAARRPRSRWLLLGGAALLLALGLVAGGRTVVHAIRSQRTEAAHLQSLDIHAPPGESLTGSFALSPKGTRVVALMAEGTPERSRLWVRPITNLAWQPLAGTEGASLPFWSPDERFVGFFAQGKLKTIDLQSGALSTLTEAPRGRGGSWGAKGVILFAPEVANSILAIPAAGGRATAVTELGDAPSHRFPCFMPDGDRFLYLALREDRDHSEIRWGRLSGPEGGRVATSNSGPLFGDPHYALFARRGTLLALSIDMASLGPVGRPSVIGEVGVYGEDGPTGLGAFSAGAGGALATMVLLKPPLHFVWIDRQGHARPAPGPPGDYTAMDLSHDGTRLAAVRIDARRRSSDLVVIDMRSGIQSEITNDAFPDAHPIWAPAGDELAFASLRSGEWTAWSVNSAAGGAQPRRIEGCSEVSAFFSDGQSAVCSRPLAETPEFWRVPLDPNGKPTLLVTVRVDEPPQAAVSPDGSRFVYSSAEGGRRLLFLRELRPGSEPIFLAAGENPHWRSDGRELYFLASGKLMAVTVPSKLPLEVAEPRPLFDAPGSAAGPLSDFPPQFAPSADGSEFLFAVPDPGESPPTIHYARPWITQGGPSAE